MKDISRTAQCVAIGLFGLGRCAEVGFGTPGRIGKECKRGLDELVREGMLTMTHEGDGLRYRATELMGRPMWEYKPIDPENPDEMFPIVVPMSTMRKKK